MGGMKLLSSTGCVCVSQAGQELTVFRRLPDDTQLLHEGTVIRSRKRRRSDLNQIARKSCIGGATDASKEEEGRLGYYGEDLKLLAEKSYPAAGPDLTDDAREQLALNQYLTMGVQGNPLHLHSLTQ